MANAVADSAEGNVVGAGAGVEADTFSFVGAGMFSVAGGAAFSATGAGACMFSAAGSAGFSHAAVNIKPKANNPYLIKRMISSLVFVALKKPPAGRLASGAGPTD